MATPEEDYKLGMKALEEGKYRVLNLHAAIKAVTAEATYLREENNTLRGELKKLGRTNEVLQEVRDSMQACFKSADNVIKSIHDALGIRYSDEAVKAIQRLQNTTKQFRAIDGAEGSQEEFNHSVAWALKGLLEENPVVARAHIASLYEQMGAPTVSKEIRNA